MKGIPTLRLKRLKQAAVVAGIGVAVAGASLLGTASAYASVAVLGTDHGAVSLTPGNGNMSVTPTYSTTEGCPTGFQGSGTLELVGPTTGDGFDILANINNSVAAPFSGTFNNPLSLENSVFPDIDGTTSEIVIKCTASASGQGASEFVMDTFLTVSQDGTTYTTSGTAPSGPVATTTTLTASSPAFAGENVTLTATVSPANATGTVVFMNGATAINSTPATVTGGVATTTTQFATAGAESLTAVYTPTTGTSFVTSTGSLSLTVSPPPANSGAIPLAVSVPTTGTFTLTVDTADTVNLTVAGLTGTGATTAIGVSDTRNTYPGWSVSGQDGAWTGTGTAAGGTFSGNQLGWAPTDTALAPGVTLGSPVTAANPGLGTTAATLASVHAGLGNGFGTSTLGANLSLVIPPTAPAGPYTSGLTISAVTSNP